ncbi:FG-GAP-like repeat-containing protein [Actinoallomurus vinaceus]|uniref:FG-GAP-like repeat-containing protein n=1 Tax=Actinoallomurus vinaceus TaxID=1080074 RepID=A0ABP8U352_9ACTN
MKIPFKPLTGALAAITVLGTVTALAVAQETAANASPATASAAAKPKRPAVAGDFNGDGRRDLVAASPEGNVGDTQQAGFISVVYGGTKGLDPKKKQIISENSAGVPGAAKSGDLFGMAIASADFDQDGYADLAATTHGHNGIVIVYGSERGLSSRTIFLKARGAGWFASQITLGDFDANGVTDLVTPAGSGFVTFRNVRKRAVAGTTTAVTGAGTYRQIKTAAGDFNGDHRTDLAVFVDAEGPDDDPVALWAELRLGTRKGLGAKKVFGKGWAGQDLGLVGDVNGDHKADLIVQRGSLDDKGPKGYNVLLGTKTGLGAAKTYNDRWMPRAVGDLNGDGKADVVGIDRHEDKDGNYKIGTLSVRPGTAKGLSPKSGPSITRQSLGYAIPSRFNGDTFGDGLKLADFTGDRRADLLIGFPYDNLSEQASAGRIHLLRGTSSGVSLQGGQRVDTDQLGITGRELHEFGEYLLDY